MVAQAKAKIVRGKSRQETPPRTNRNAALTSAIGVENKEISGIQAACCVVEAIDEILIEDDDLPEM